MLTLSTSTHVCTRLYMRVLRREMSLKKGTDPVFSRGLSKVQDFV